MHHQHESLSSISQSVHLRPRLKEKKKYLIDKNKKKKELQNTFKILKLSLYKLHDIKFPEFIRSFRQRYILSDIVQNAIINS